MEIDESDFGATLSPTVLRHLLECGECREFQDKETKLRQIVGSLETVNAPADFDFRLRARLANSEGRSAYNFLSSGPLMRSPGFAVAVLILLVVGAFAFLRQFVPRESQIAVTPPAATGGTTATTTQPEESKKTIQEPQPGNDATSRQTLAENTTPQSRRAGGSIPGHKRTTVAVDFGSDPAPVVHSGQSVAGMTTFPLDISQESFKVSIDDGRGTSRTISLPGVSFGSRRVLTGRNVSNQFAPSGAW